LPSEALRILLALLAAAAASATLFVSVDLSGLLFLALHTEIAGLATAHVVLLWIPAFIVALAHAAALGLPAYMVLKRLRLTRWWVSLPSGFLIGALPYAMLALPWRSPPAELVEAHIVPGFTWLHYGEMAGGLGLLGMAGGFAAWLVWRWLTPPVVPARRP
jgi:hypothetical protein